MKKHKYVIAIVAAIFVSADIGFAAYLWNNPITFSISANWSINFIGYPVIYHVDSSPQNHPKLSELKYFTVLECKDFKDIKNKVAWKDDANENERSAVLKLASELNVNRNYIPDFSKSYKYFTTTTDGIDTLYLIYVPLKNCVYVVEDINHASAEESEQTGQQQGEKQLHRLKCNWKKVFMLFGDGGFYDILGSYYYN